jgi:catechol 2,3-dioxygenase-like lactoylglutathione lyase family enzyme
MHPPPVGSNFEIFEYSASDQLLEQPKNSDIGGHHLAFYVDDIGAAITYLKANGIRVLGEPIVREDGRALGRVGSIFSVRGACSSNWCPSRTARLMSVARAVCSGIRRCLTDRRHGGHLGTACCPS